MPTVSTGPDAYQSLDRIRQRIDYQPDDFFQDNAALRFDELLVELEQESRGIFETLWGDQTPLTETGRVDTFASVPGEPAMKLVYPIQTVTQVEYKVSEQADWEVMDANRYANSDHHLILSERPTLNSIRYEHRANPLTRDAKRPGWGDWAERLRVTYDRGFGSSPPQDVQSVQIALIENMLASRQLQQTAAAGSPEELAQAIDQDSIVTESIRSRIDDVTKPGYATMSV